MNVQYYPTSDNEQAQLFKCCTYTLEHSPSLEANQ
jgi:hypothetical protein